MKTKQQTIVIFCIAAQGNPNNSLLFSCSMLIRRSGLAQSSDNNSALNSGLLNRRGEASAHNSCSSSLTETVPVASLSMNANSTSSCSLALANRFLSCDNAITNVSNVTPAVRTPFAFVRSCDRTSFFRVSPTNWKALLSCSVVRNPSLSASSDMKIPFSCSTSWSLKSQPVGRVPSPDISDHARVAALFDIVAPCVVMMYFEVQYRCLDLQESAKGPQLTAVSDLHTTGKIGMQRPLRNVL
jgi:hypothetical protein